MDRDLDGIKQLLVQIQRDSSNAHVEATERQKEESIKIATAEIDRICRFKGHKATAAQALSWPRVGATDKDGKAVTGIPPAIKDAVAFLAGAHLAGYQIGPNNRDHSRALVTNLLAMLDGLLDPENPTQDDMPVH